MVETSGEKRRGTDSESSWAKWETPLKREKRGGGRQIVMPRGYMIVEEQGAPQTVLPTHFCGPPTTSLTTFKSTRFYLHPYIKILDTNTESKPKVVYRKQRATMKINTGKCYG